MATLLLTGSVGEGSSKNGVPHNEITDVIKVRDRFVQLGYHWVSGITDGKNKDFIRLIKFFQTICKSAPAGLVHRHHFASARSERRTCRLF